MNFKIDKSMTIKSKISLANEMPKIPHYELKSVDMMTLKVEVANLWREVHRLQELIDKQVGINQRIIEILKSK